MAALIYTNVKASQIEKLIRYQFKDKGLCVQAVQMAAPTITVIHNNTSHGLKKQQTSCHPGRCNTC